MERIRAAAELSPEQANDWEFFKTTWDREMADAQQEKWGDIFAELVQHILNELAAGKKRRSPSSCMQRRSECWETCPR